MLNQLGLLRTGTVLTMALGTWLGCQQAGDIERDIDVSPAERALGTDSNAADPAHAPMPASRGNLSPGRRIELDAKGKELVARLSTPEAPESREPPTDGVATSTDDDSAAGEPDVAELWNLFLDSVTEGPRGGFVVGDMAFQTEEDLLALFEAIYDARSEKGLILPSAVWAGSSPSLKVCWTPNSTATAAQKTRVRNLIQNSWARLSGITFDFGVGSTFNTCAEAPCSPGDFFKCAPEQIKIYQADSTHYYCSVVGNQSQTAASITCKTGVPPASDYASMWLPTDASQSGGALLTDPLVPNTPIYVDATTVHEFGHAIGLLHEHQRGDYGQPGTVTCAAGNGAAPTTGQSTFGSAFDNDSIMNYCHPVTLDGATFIDPRQTEISVGDIFSSRALYLGKTQEFRFSYASWSNAQVSFGIAPLGQVTTFLTATATQTPQTLATGQFGIVGEAYTVSATVLDNPRIRCSTVKPSAIGVFGGPAIVPPLGFTAQPILGVCYDVASLAAAVS